jgi:hypothetical protein
MWILLSWGCGQLYKQMEQVQHLQYSSILEEQQHPREGHRVVSSSLGQQQGVRAGGHTRMICCCQGCLMSPKHWLAHTNKLSGLVATQVVVP